MAISPDGKLAAFGPVSGVTHHLEAVDLASRRVIFKGQYGCERLWQGPSTLFARQPGAGVPRSSRGGITLLYQPLDGTPPHTLLDPGAPINDFGWSPSGKQLAVARVKSSSDVVLITDQNGKNAH
jgi:hypothetical protein